VAGRTRPGNGDRDVANPPRRPRAEPNPAPVSRSLAAICREAPAGTPPAPRGPHEPLHFADHAGPHWTHDDGVAPLSNESQPSPLAAVDVRGRSGDAAGAGASDAAGRRRTVAHARSGAVPGARQQPPGGAIRARGPEVRAPGEHRPQQASAAVPLRRAGRLPAAALRLQRSRRAPSAPSRRRGRSRRPTPRSAPRPGSRHPSRPRSINR
jgi:hypothetical protein